MKMRISDHITVEFAQVKDYNGVRLHRKEGLPYEKNRKITFD